MGRAADLAASDRDPGRDPSHRPVGALIHGAPTVCGPDTTIREAAKMMVASGSTAVVIDGGDGSLGIMTDRDLRTRVVAAGLAGDGPVSRAMSAPAYTCRPDRLGADVLLEMLDRGFRHFPVVSATGNVLGEPEAEFACLALGSQARREPMPSSDVDSAIVGADPDLGARRQPAGAGDPQGDAGRRLVPARAPQSGVAEAAGLDPGADLDRARRGGGVRGDWRDFRPAIWLAMLGIAVILLVNPPYWGAVFLGAAIGVAIRIAQRRRRLTDRRSEPPRRGRG
jgi:CBS domain-containing protein